MDNPFRTQGHRLVDILADHLERTPNAVYPPHPPDVEVAFWRDMFTARPDVLQVLQTYVQRATQVHAPGYMGHQVAAPLPEAAWCHAVVALMNNSGAVYEMSPAATAMEHVVVQWMAQQLGLGASAGGVLTSGGSLGNLTALLAARQARAGFDAWGLGAQGGPPLAIIASKSTHYCVSRAAHIMGLGDAGVLLAEVDEDHRLDPDSVRLQLRDAGARGMRVFAVVANACSTAVGAYDPLSDLADLCTQHHLWLHVDGAHGASACLSPQYRHRLAGIERADSVVWDAHKMLMLPSLVTGVLFRDKRHGTAALTQQASYLLGADAETEWFNASHRTIECTRPALSLPLYALLAAHGPEPFAQHVTRTYDLARSFAAMLDDADDFELATPPQANIVCFRYTPPGVHDLNALQLRARRHVNMGGAFHIVQTTLGEEVYLRITVINPATTLEHLRALAAALRGTQVPDGA